jgi:ribosomal protein S18 acetylase RimI-like enzyme
LKKTVRRLTSNDYQAVKEIEKIVVKEYRHYLKETGEKDTIKPWITPQYFDHYMKAENSFVAETDGKVVGFILAQPTTYLHGAEREIWLEYIAVHPESRKKGIGSMLISMTVKQAHSHGVKLLHTTLNPNNNESNRLLVKHGFEVKDWKEAKRELKKREGRSLRPDSHE